MSKEILKRSLYENCCVRDKNGDIIFYSSIKRARWYLKRNLATILNEDPLEIKLTFETNGKGNFGDEFYLQQRKNVCVVCGQNESGINRHHIVPSSFRRHLPNYIKDHSYHDVVPLCPTCHEQYEKHSNELRLKLEAEYSAPVSGAYDKDLYIDFEHGQAYARTLLGKHRNKIPPERAQELLAFIKELFGTTNLIHVASVEFDRPRTEPQGKIVVDKLTDVQAFISRWRQHFLDTMKPTHMPLFWRVDRIER